jgi:sugar phosphate isomerase/epimerase
MTLAQRIERKLGFQSLFDFEDAVEAVEFAADNGFRSLELNLGNRSYLDQLHRPRERARIQAAAERMGIDLLVHSVDGLGFFKSDWRYCRANLDLLKQLINDAARTGVKHFTFHLGSDMAFGYVGGKKYTWEIYPEAFAANLRRVLEELRSLAKGPMTLGVENVGGFRYPWVFPIMHEILGGYLRLTMDVGHINVFKGRVKRAELAFFKDHARLIRGSHVHDNDSKGDQHEIIGNGHIDFLPYFRMLGELNAYCIFEVRPKEAAMECRRRFRTQFIPRLNHRPTPTNTD